MYRERGTQSEGVCVRERERELYWCMSWGWSCVTWSFPARRIPSSDPCEMFSCE